MQTLVQVVKKTKTKEDLLVQICGENTLCYVPVLVN